ncbi:HalOD1 output domain-containing protein [Halomicroarcula sp. GCM10025894]|uniref:HalOD1 output domain-containing protein n=1 Tax=Halomicroarcula sp. GCM10025894 TaxID=3252673 RepID=UPI00360C667C
MSKTFDWSETPPSVAVVRLLSVATNSDPTAVEPLAEAIDPDALDRLLPSMDADSHLEFTHSCFAVSLYGDGRVAVEPEDC